MKRLPVLDYISGLYDGNTLSDTAIIACQHLLGTTVHLFDALLEKGVDKKNIFIIGKCYSSHKKVIEQLRTRGIYVSPLSVAYKKNSPFDEQFEENIEKFLTSISKKIQGKTFRKIIILDDGGHMLYFANDFFRKNNNIVGVEQTSSGFHKVQTLSLNFPIINVARSKTKLHIESKFIAEKLFETVVKVVKRKKKRNPHILVVGNGPIGKNIYSLLKNKYRVSRYDLKTHGYAFPGTFEKKLCQFDVILGATGTTILSPGHFFNLKKNTLLMSCSSSDREFSAEYLRRLNKKMIGCHGDVYAKGIILINSGFPINFDGAVHSVHPKYIQLTRGLLLSGVLQAAATSSEPKIYDLDRTLQKNITKIFKQSMQE